MSAQDSPPIVVGIDTGGTFTDFVVLDGGRLSVHKVPSTPDDPARAVLDGLRHVLGGRTADVVHGLTVATNALLERRGWRQGCGVEDRRIDTGTRALQTGIMRTTLTIEPDVDDRLRQEARQTGRRMTEIVNRALRIGLGMTRRREPPSRFEVRPYPLRFKPEVDLDRMHQLLDDLEAEEVAHKLARDRG